MKLQAAVITTYACHSRCTMCGIWKHRIDEREDIRPIVLERLPELSFCNITGGEPFLRKDIGDIVAVLKKKARRIVVSTNGYLTDQILCLARNHPDIGFRISLEGLPKRNDELRGMADGFDHGLKTLLGLMELGLKDIGLAVTVSDTNAADLLPLHRLACRMRVDFATAAVHNSFYFHMDDNRISDPESVARRFMELAEIQLRSRRIKDWYRAYFNAGLAGYVSGATRPLPCGAGRDIFFIDPRGEVLPCNGMEERFWFESMGNLLEQAFDEIWSSEQARRVREKVRTCPKNCWMIGTAAPAMKRHLFRTTAWIARRKAARAVRQRRI
ncbi:MAG: radical SAM protein [Acidobacteriota bacterium]|nr:radical SAM protein [Acidobacteriota bacterium]